LAKITTRTARAKLAEKREPYWSSLGRGRALGFRRGPDTWIARLTTADGRKPLHALSPELGPDADYDAAKKAAEAWFKAMSSTARRTVKRGTVRSALAAYLRHLRSNGKRDTARAARGMFHLTVKRSDPFGLLPLEDVTQDDTEAWRARLRKGRAARSVNRYVRQVVAALNKAVEKLGYVGNPAAWTLEALSDDLDESGDAAVFLTVEQRERLIAHAPEALGAYLQGLAHTGARPSELGNATVQDFDAVGGTITVKNRKGRGSRLRTRAVTLSDAGIEFFKAQKRGRIGKAPLIVNAEGKHWTRIQWSRGIRAAATEANKTAKGSERIPPNVSAYSFRHSRISELLQVYAVDPLTVAQQTGTGLTMIERYYFKFISSSMKDKLNAVKGVRS
jgi:integrase